MNNLGRYNPFIRPLHLCDSSDFTKSHYVKQVEALVAQLGELIGSTRDYAPGREKDFKLDRGESSLASERNEGEKLSERKLEFSLYEEFSKPGKLKGQISEHLTHIPCYQLPLKAPGKKTLSKGWGYVDLLGCAPDKAPSIIELKKAASRESPLRMIVEGLAYAVAIQEMWKQKGNDFQNDWFNAIDAKDVNIDLDKIKIIGLAPDDYWRFWKDSAKNQSDQGDWGEANSKLIDAAEKQGFEIRLASFDDSELSKGIQLVCHKSFQPIS